MMAAINRNGLTIMVLPLMDLSRAVKYEAAVGYFTTVEAVNFSPSLYENFGVIFASVMTNAILKIRAFYN